LEPEYKEQHIKWLHDFLKELPCLKGEEECKVNLVQGEGGWKTPEESWMDMEEAEDEVYFVNVLHEEEPNSDDKMQRELEETKAAVDVSILRRARRVGVNVERSKVTRMSEAECDRICEEIGDQPGAQTKRRREIKDMNEEDIEAEIDRTEAAMVERAKSAARGKRGSRMEGCPG
jgi:hypothetical protein